MPAEIHEGDVGTVFEATIVDEEAGVVNLALASVRQLKFRRPDGVVVTKTALLVTDGSDGKETYASEVDFLRPAGLWRWQPYTELPDWQGHGDMQEFRVYPNLG